jgi:MFS family permease
MRDLLPALTRDQWLLFINNLLWGSGGALYLYIQPIYLSELKASPEQIGIALGLSVLVVTLGYVPLGMWADHLGQIGQLGTAGIAGVTLFTWLFGRMKIGPQ